MAKELLVGAAIGLAAVVAVRHFEGRRRAELGAQRFAFQRQVTAQVSSTVTPTTGGRRNEDIVVRRSA